MNNDNSHPPIPDCLALHSSRIREVGMRDHVAIAKKAARTRKRMKEAREPTDRTEYFKDRHLSKKAARQLKLLRDAGYMQVEFESVMRSRGR